MYMLYYAVNLPSWCLAIFATSERCILSCHGSCVHMVKVWQTRRQTETRQRRQREKLFGNLTGGKRWRHTQNWDSKHGLHGLLSTKRALTRQVCWNLFDLFLLGCALTDVIKEVRIRTRCRFGTSEYTMSFRSCPVQQHTAIEPCDSYK